MSTTPSFLAFATTLGGVVEWLERLTASDGPPGLAAIPAPGTPGREHYEYAVNLLEFHRMHARLVACMKALEETARQEQLVE